MSGQIGLTPPFVTPDDQGMQRKSTRQLLKKIPGFPCLYRHDVNEIYYGITKVLGNRKEHSLGTTDRRHAERNLKAWLQDLAKIEPGNARKTVGNLLEEYQKNLAGKKEKTRRTRMSILKRFQETWTHGERIRASSVTTHQLNEWLAQHEGRLKNSTYNEYARFLKDLFEIAVHDRVIAKSPFAVVTTKWKKPQKPSRPTPSTEEFKAIVADIRAQRFNPDASASADFVEFLGLAGLGQKEAGTLLWSQIDLKQKRMGIRRHKTGVLFYVPIYPHLAPLLERLHSQRESPKQDGLVFEIKDAKKALSAACVRLGLPNYSQRAIRRALIRLLWRAGIDKKLIAKWQGHSDGGKLIMDTYTEDFGSDDDAYEQMELKKITPGAN